MPLYEYRCNECGHHFEVLVRVEQSAEPFCPECGHDRVARQLSVFKASTATPGNDVEFVCPSMDGTCSDGNCPYAKG